MTLLFSTEARRQFDPLAQQYGLTCVASTEWEVRYENDQVFLTINFDGARSSELSVEVGTRDARYPGPPYSLPEILRLRGVRDAASISGLMISDRSRLQDALARLAELTTSHASDFLAGSDSSFAQVAKLRNKESAEFELASRLRHARAMADVAWAARDYKAIVQVFEPVESHLSQAEKKRLEYSRKQISP